MFQKKLFFDHKSLCTLQVMPLLSHPNERIVYEVLAFLEAILEFGNTHVQKGLNDLIQSREHQVFPTLRAILKSASVVYKERYVINMSCCDLFD